MTGETGDAKSLQFDTAIPSGARAEAGAPAATGVSCVACQRPLKFEYFDINGQTVCINCRGSLAEQAATPTGFGVLGKAVALGLVAAVLGAVLYYAVIAITDFEIGIVAIAIGYMVGYGIRMATGGRGGLRFQILAVVLTYWAVGLAYTPLAFKGLAEQDQEAESSVHSIPGMPATPEPAEPAPVPASDTRALAEDNGEGDAERPNLFAVAGFLIALSMALPVLVVMGSLPGGLISAAIIVFGMLQAWKMTAGPRLVITGPFRIVSPVATA